MAGLRGRRYLQCFYCGKRSDTRYDGIIRQFYCRHCDATNYLDEHGDITDPPIAKTSALSSARQFAIQRPTSPEFARPSDDIFCATCQKNQHLFTSSLAQYLPDDPNDPEYPELEKNYYKFRRGLESRYPQICEDCEPRMLERLQQAGYAAKTDYLRRMMDKSRSRRQVPKQRTALDYANTAGRWFWTASFALELLWHLSRIEAIPERQEAQYFGNPALRAISMLQSVLQALPRGNGLMVISFWANVATVWWNPLFVQVFRGFSSHILGLSQWYTLQIIILLVRYILAYQGQALSAFTQGGGKSAEISAQVFIGLFVLFTSWMARRSVHVNAVPLFGVDNTPVSTPKSAMRDPIRKTPVGSTKNISNILDEILTTPSAAAIAEDDETSDDIFRPMSRRKQVPLAQPTGGLFGSPPVPNQPLQQQSSNGDEMDWTPTQSAHRAFTDYGSPQKQSQASWEREANPFWYKVPPAPMEPARKVRNPPLGFTSERPKAATVGFPSSRATETKNGQPLCKQEGLTQRNVEFREPRFIIEQDRHDPRGSLADLLMESFSLSQEPESPKTPEQPGPAAKPEGDGTLSRLSGLRTARVVDMFILAFFSLLWWLAARTAYEYRAYAMTGVLCGCSAIALQVTYDTLRDMRHERGFHVASVAGAILGVCELTVSAYLALQTWNTGGEGDGCEAWPFWLMGTMIAHQFWNAIL